MKDIKRFVKLSRIEHLKALANAEPVIKQHALEIIISLAHLFDADSLLGGSKYSK